MLFRRSLLLACTALSALALPAWAQGPIYPAAPVTLVVPFTTGTGADLLARLLGPKLADRWKVAVVTDNKAGASGAIGTNAVAKAAPTGLTVLVTATAHGTVPALSPKLPYAPLQAFTPVVLLGTSSKTFSKPRRPSLAI